MTAFFVVIGIAFVLSFVPMFVLFVRRYIRYRRSRIVLCPDTRQTATVKVNARRAAWTSVVDEPDLKLASCSCSPAASSCSEGCLSQVEGEPAADLA